MLPNLRFCLRTLQVNPGFAATVIFTIALGIGVNAAVFSLVNGVLLKSLPYADPDRLVRFHEHMGENIYDLSYPNYEDWRQRSHVFQEMAIYNPANTLTIRVHGAAEIVPSAATQWNLFSMLGVKPILGRGFLADEDKGAGADVVLITYEAWARYFDNDPKIIGRQIPVTGGVVAIVGVLPESFQLGSSAIWYPMGDVRNRNQLDRGNHMNFTAIGRLKAGVTIERARAEMDAIADSLEQEYPSANKGFKIVITSMLDSMVGGVRSTLWLLFGAVGFILLIACTNVANLLLTRTINRGREFAVRTALGATRGQVLRLMIIESLLLCAAGAVVGVWLATWSLELLKLQPRSLPRPVAIDQTVLAYCAFLTLLATLTFALVPVWRAGKGNLAESLKQGGRGLSASKTSKRAGSALVAAEVALSIALVAGAGLMIRSIYILQHEDLGFRPNNLLAARMFLTFHQDRAQDTWARQAYEQLDAIRAIPGVETAAAMWPLAEGNNDSAWLPNVNFEDRPRDPGTEPRVEAAMVTPDYFKTMGIPLLRGRSFAEADLDAHSSAAVVVSEMFAKSFYPGGKALGKRIRMVGAVGVQGWKEIVGIVGDTQRAGLGGPIVPEVYWPYGQIGSLDTAFVARTRVDAQTLFNPLRGAAARVDGDTVVYRVDTMDNILFKTISERRLTQLLLTAFAILALVLACVGIYGVVAVSVAQRTQEIGIRVALGASSANVFRLVLSQIAMPAGVGLALGLAVAGMLTPFLASQVYGVAPRDPLTFLTAAMVLGGVAALASLLPARRAIRIDPMLALRQE
jgi:predicted permease